MYLLPRVPAWLSGTVHLPVQQRQVRSLGREDPLEEGVATHSGILAGKVPWTEEPSRLYSMGSQRIGHN